jgi:hypothetical protein
MPISLTTTSHLFSSNRWSASSTEPVTDTSAPASLKSRAIDFRIPVSSSTTNAVTPWSDTIHKGPYKWESCKSARQLYGRNCYEATIGVVQGLIHTPCRTRSTNRSSRNDGSHVLSSLATSVRGLLVRYDTPRHALRAVSARGCAPRFRYVVEPPTTWRFRAGPRYNLRWWPARQGAPRR